MTPKDFADYVNIEEAVELIDIEGVPFSKYIQERFHGRDAAEIAFPGGMIRTVIEAFKKQIAPGGIFMISDMGTALESERTPVYDAMRCNPSRTGGAIFQTADAIVAKAILEREFGFKVKLLSLADFTRENIKLAPKNIRNKVDISKADEDLAWMYMMIISR